MPRRKRISFEQRQRIVRAYENDGEDYLIVSDTLGVNRSTARSIVARYLRDGRIRERPRGGANNVRVDDEMRECLQDILNENCLLTLAQMNEELQKRHDYANWFMGHAVVNHCVFIDECGFNIWTSRSQGRARIGERAYRQVCGQRGRNITITLAVSPTSGLIFQTAMIGGMNRVRFNDFLAETRRNLDPDERVIFIYDGAPAHTNPENPDDENTELKKLPPYSPFLNIVEQAISALKAAIKADISRPEIQQAMCNRQEARRQGTPLGQYRTQLLLEALHRNVGTITVAKCGQYRFMQTYIPRAMNREQIEV